MYLPHMPYADLAKRQELQRRRGRLPSWSTNLPFRYGSVPYLALGYLKMVRRPVGTAELRAFSTRLRDARAALDKIVDAGYATYDAERRATITDAGVTVLYILGWRGALARRHPEELDEDLDG